MFFEVRMNNRRFRINGSTVEDILYYLPAGVEYSHDIRIDAVAWDAVDVTITPNYNDVVMGNGWSTFNEDLVMRYLDEYEDAVYVASRHEYWRVEFQSYEEIDNFFGA